MYHAQVVDRQTSSHQQYNRAFPGKAPQLPAIWRDASDVWTSATWAEERTRSRSCQWLKPCYTSAVWEHQMTQSVVFPRTDRSEMIRILECPAVLVVSKAWLCYTLCGNFSVGMHRSTTCLFLHWHPFRFGDRTDDTQHCIILHHCFKCAVSIVPDVAGCHRRNLGRHEESAAQLLQDWPSMWGQSVSFHHSHCFRSILRLVGQQTASVSRACTQQWAFLLACGRFATDLFSMGFFARFRAKARWWR